MTTLTSEQMKAAGLYLQQDFTYSKDQEGCFLCSWQKLRPLKSQASSRLARQICEKWLSPNSASRRIIPGSPQHLFQIRSRPSPSLLLEDSCALPAALPCLEKLPRVPDICWYYSSQTSVQQGPKCPWSGPSTKQRLWSQDPAVGAGRASH